MKKLESLCQSVFDDGFDRTDVYELAEEAMKLLAKYKLLQKKHKKTETQLNSLLLMVKPQSEDAVAVAAKLLKKTN